MDWEESRDLARERWHRIALAVREHDVKRIRSVLLHGCPECRRRQHEWWASGNGNSEIVLCDFCHSYLDDSGCRNTLSELLAALDRENWEQVHSEVASVRDLLDSMRVCYFR